MEGWKKILRIDIPGEIYSKINRRVNPLSGRLKNFPVKDDIKNVIRNSSCKSKFYPGEEGSNTEVAEWLCEDGDEKTFIVGTYKRGLRDNKRITELAVFDVFTPDGSDTSRSNLIKDKLPSEFGGVVQFLIDEDYKEKLREEENKRRKDLSNKILLDFKNPEVVDIIDDITNKFDIELDDAVMIVNRYKWMPSREKHWVPFGIVIKKYKDKYNLSTDDLKSIFEKLHGSGVKVE